jgi:hypothetical protein
VLGLSELEKLIGISGTDVCRPIGRGGINRDNDLVSELSSGPQQPLDIAIRVSGDDRQGQAQRTTRARLHASDTCQLAAVTRV